MAKRGRPKKRKIVRRRIPKPVPLEDIKAVAADMGMTVTEYINHIAAENRRKQGQTKVQRSTYKIKKTSTDHIDLDLRKTLKLQPKKGPL